jgi:tRNA(Ile)-lysidine synthase
MIFIGILVKRLLPAPVSACFLNKNQDGSFYSSGEPMTQASKNLLGRFEAHLLEKSFFGSGERILVACSGGPDSVALFHLLHELSPENKWELGLVHFNHQLRPGAAKTDERFVKTLARKFHVPFDSGTGNVKHEARETKTSIEEAARKMRYDFFLKTAKRRRIKKVVLAHTLGDQAETVLMRILQGTGLRGLQGIREVYKIKGVSFIRPLLTFTKEELLNFLRMKGIASRKDESNGSSQFLRNRIRLKLIPMLQRDFNPRIVEALSRIPAIVSEESELIAGLEERAWKKTFKKIRGVKVELRRAPFLKCHPALQFRLVDKALKLLDRQSGLSFEAWERLRRGLARPRFCCSLPKDIDFALTPKNLALYKKQRDS